jgi:hypothetical protein
VPALGEFFNRFPVECWNVIRLATRNQAVVHDDFLIASGETYEMPHPDFISISPRGSYVIVIDAEERPHHLNAQLINRASPAQRPRARKEPEALSEINQRDSVRAFAAGILNASICFLISLAKAAAPAPFTTL